MDTPALIEVPRGLNGVAVTSTTIGDVRGEEGFFHYREYDAVSLAEACNFEEVWQLVAGGHLPAPDEAAAFAARTAALREVPAELLDALTVVARMPGSAMDRLRSALSIAAGVLGLAPVIDLTPAERAAQAERLAAITPSLVAALHRLSIGQQPLPNDLSLGHAAQYLFAVTGTRPTAEAARALERYLILTVDHGFNASTFTARVVASTGADLGAVAVAALGALSGPLHGGAPSRALDALDAIGDPANTEAWVEAETAAGRRIMGFGHAVYRTVDPRSRLLRRVALELGGPLVDRAVEVEARVEATLDRLKPGRPLASNVEFYAGVVMAAAGLPRELFSPTFAVSRMVGWMAHAVEQAAEGKLIRPAARYVGPPPARP